MKEKSTKQSKKDKPAVQIKDLKPTKDAQGQRALMPSRDIEMIRRPGGRASASLKSIGNQNLIR
jgi:hypothetical protein